MTPIEIILSGLSLAFCIVEVLDFKRFKIKPFSCLMCMTGWCSFTISLLAGHTYTSILFLACGVFVGAMFEALKMKCL